MGVFNSGLLSREWPAEGMKYDCQDAPPERLARARAIAEVCTAHGTSLPAAAIAFPYTHPSTVNVTLGMRDRAHVTQNVELQRSAVPRALWDDLRCQGLIRPDVPAASRIQGTADRPSDAADRQGPPPWAGHRGTKSPPVRQVVPLTDAPEPRDAREP